MPPYDIAPRVMQAWQASGLTKAQLADKAGMRWAQVQKVLTGKRPQVSADTVRRLARALGCTTDYLLGMDNEKTAEDTAAHDPAAWGWIELPLKEDG
jgi:transcriptional regulator with XRE-family HTH domain